MTLSRTIKFIAEGKIHTRIELMDEKSSTLKRMSTMATRDIWRTKRKDSATDAHASFDGRLSPSPTVENESRVRGNRTNERKTHIWLRIGAICATNLCPQHSLPLCRRDRRDRPRHAPSASTPSGLEHHTPTVTPNATATAAAANQKCSAMSPPRASISGGAPRPHAAAPRNMHEYCNEYASASSPPRKMRANHTKMPTHAATAPPPDSLPEWTRGRGREEHTGTSSVHTSLPSRQPRQIEQSDERQRTGIRQRAARRTRGARRAPRAPCRPSQTPWRTRRPRPAQSGAAARRRARAQRRRRCPTPT